MEYQEKGEGKLGTLLEEGRRESSSTSCSDFGNNGDQHCGSCTSQASTTTTSPSWAFPSPSVVDVAGQCKDMSLVDVQCKVQLQHEPALSEMDMMKERFAKLLLGEDMSGSGNGVSTALAISNAITNLCATLFGQLWRLEPMAPEKKSMWRREIEWLLCVGDYIVELIPTWQNFPDGTKLEIMTCRPRSDLYINLPALRKLDNMLIEILDSFQDTEFWYVDQGIIAAETDGSTSFRRQLKRQEEKWWLPVPRVPPNGLREDVRKRLQQKRDSTSQILKAVMAINSITLADMDVPSSYLDNLPKNGRASLGELMYRYMTSDQFSPECLLDCLDLSSEHQAIEIANRVESSMYLWRQKGNSKPNNGTKRNMSKSSWDFVKDLMVDIEKRELLADRAESLLISLKQRFPGLPQTTLDMSKIQYNKDVGKAILESYSRVLESLAFNIIARIDDLLYVDDISKHSDHMPSLPKISVVTPKYMVPKSTASKTTYATPSPLSSGKGERDRSPLRSPFLSSSNKISSHNTVGFRKALTDYVNVDANVRIHGSLSTGPELISSIVKEESGSHSESAQIERAKETVSMIST